MKKRTSIKKSLAWLLALVLISTLALPGGLWGSVGATSELPTEETSLEVETNEPALTDAGNAPPETEELPETKAPLEPEAPAEPTNTPLMTPEAPPQPLEVLPEETEAVTEATESTPPETKPAEESNETEPPTKPLAPGDTLNEEKTPPLETKETEPDVPEASLPAELTETPETDPAEVFGMNQIMPFAVSTPGYFYTTDVTVPLTLNVAYGNSTNTHTRLTKMWVGMEGGTPYVYFASKSTHRMNVMVLKEGTQSVTAIAYIEYDPWVNIYINDEVQNLGGLTGNTDSSHWTIFRFTFEQLAGMNLNDGVVYGFSLESQYVGQGHWVEGQFTAEITYVKANLTKTWIGGPMPPVQAELQVRRLGSSDPYANVGMAVTLTTASPSYTWVKLPYTNSLGQVLQYNVAEVAGGDGYIVEFTSSYDAATLTYTFTLLNRYIAAGEFQPAVTKQLYAGGRTLQAGAFHFSFKDVTDAANPIVIDAAVPNNANGTIDFKTVKYVTEMPATPDPNAYYQIASGGSVFRYEIKEVVPATPETGMTYDVVPRIVTVTLNDSGTGQLIPDVVYSPNDRTFTNRYEATATWTPEVTKVLTGRALLDREFEFVLMRDGTAVQTVRNLEDGTIPFLPIYFNENNIGQTWQFEIRESTGVNTGMTYDPMIVRYTLVISDAGNGQLTIDVTQTSEGGSSVTDLEFNNTYTASGSFVPEATKTINRTLAADEFEFQLFDSDNQLISSAFNAADGRIEFPKIDYTLADIGTHTYSLREVAGALGGVTYDGKTITVTVVVSDNLDGTLNVDVTYTDEGTFANTYAAVGSYAPKVTKNLIGRPLNAADFEFTLYAADGSPLETVSNAADGSVTFTALTFDLTQVGEHVYTIKEVPNGLSGVEFDDKTVTLTLNVSDNGDGTLRVMPTYTGGTTFYNIFTASGSWVPQVSKVLTGRVLKEGEFNFQLVNKDDTTPALTLTASNAADGKVIFPIISYDETDAGNTYTYLITETVGSEEGMTYDTLSVEVSVTIALDAADALVVTPTYPADIQFDNVYRATGSWTPTVKKELSAGGRLLENEEFTFLLKDITNTASPVEIGSGKNNAAGVITMPTVNYTEADIGKTFVYEVSEVVGAETGMVYDDLKVIYRVTVQDNGGGQLRVTASIPDDEIFNNTYQAEGSFEPTATKLLNGGGRVIRTGDFSFTLSDITDTSNEKVLETVWNTDGTVLFTPLAYTEADIGKTFILKIVEEMGSELGMTYSTLVVTYEVSVTDAGNGQLNVVSSLTSETSQFVNTYQARGNWIPSVLKQLTAGGRTLEDGEFSFRLTNVTDPDAPVVVSDTTNTGGRVIFPTIEYTEEDINKTYTYELMEISGSETGMTYDQTVMTFTNRILDAGNGYLVVLINGPDVITFENTYVATGSYTPELSKILNAGKREIKDGEFSFVWEKLTGDDSEVLQTVTNVGNAVPFSALSFTEADIGKTYEYRIRELAGLEANMTYDDYELLFNLDITDGGNGELSIEVVYQGEQKLEFVNTYKASGSWVPDVVRKVLAGRPLAEGEFSFDFMQGDLLIETVKNKADGTIPFTPQQYTEDDIGETYIYTLKERVPDDKEEGMTYDPMVITFEVTVTDLGDGELEAVHKEVSDTVFNNTYVAENSFVLQASKNLLGRKIEAGAFTFLLKNEEGEVLQEKTNDHDGSINFDNITLDQESIGKTLLLTISEVAGSENGMTYDDHDIPVSIAVNDAGNGVLDLEITYGEEPVFVNQYEAEGSFEVKATKNLTGRPLKADEFAFELLDSEKKGVATAKNAADGTITFNSVTLNQDAIGQTLTYLMREVPGSEAGMAYDESELKVLVTVKDAGEGALDISVSYGEEPVFVNQYEAEGSFEVKATKNLTGRPLKADEFAFELLDSESKVVATAKNAADGTITFNSVTLNQDAIGQTLTYLMREVPGSEAGMTYDESELKVLVTVKDAGEGVLDLSVSYDEEPTFANKYEAKGSFDPKVQKVLNGRELKAGEFEFELLDGEQNVLQTASNGADGTVKFETLLFTEADIGTTKTFLFREKRGSDSDITYDEKAYELSLKVSDEGEGVLKVEPVETIDLVFTNTYTTPETVIPPKKTPPPVPRTGEDYVLPIGGILLLAAAALLFMLKKKREA